MELKIFNCNKILWILALGGVLVGFEISSMAVFVSSDQFIKYFNNPSSLKQGIIAGSNPAGAFFGCWIAGVTSDMFGRVFTIQLGSFLWIVGSIISVLVLNLWMVIGGRVVKGISVGVFSAILSVYISEVFQDRKKGLATSVIQWCITWGIMLMFCLSSLCMGIDSDLSFRVAWGIETIPGLILFIGSFFLPESPKWLASKGEWQKAANVTDQINLASKDTECNKSSQKKAKPKVSKEGGNSGSLRRGEGVLEKFGESGKACTYKDLFRKELRYHLMAGIATQAVTQLSGIGVLMYYFIFICEMVGMDANTKVLAASVQYVINVLFTIFPIVWLDKMRRKDILVFGAGSLGLCISAIGAIMGIYGYSVPPINGNESVVWEITGTPGTLCLALCFLFVAIFASTLSCVSWLYTNEIFPSRAKAKGCAICMSVSWTLNFTLTFLAPLSLQYIKWGTFCIFGGFCLIGALVIGLWFPETYDLNETEIENIFTRTPLDPEMGNREIELKELNEKFLGNGASYGNRSPNKYQLRTKNSNTLETQKVSNEEIRSAGSSKRGERSRSSSANGTRRDQNQQNLDTLSSENRRRRRKSFSERDPSERECENFGLASHFFRTEESPFGKSEVLGSSRDVSSINVCHINQSNLESYNEVYQDDPESGVISEHYYNVDSNESPFLNQYNTSPLRE